MRSFLANVNTWPTLDLHVVCGSQRITACAPDGLSLNTQTTTVCVFYFLTVLLIISSFFPPSLVPALSHSRVITSRPSLSSSHLSLDTLSKHSFIFPVCISLCSVIKTSLSNSHDSHKPTLPTLGSFLQEINNSSVDFVVQKLMTWLIYVTTQGLGLGCSLVTHTVCSVLWILIWG